MQRYYKLRPSHYLALFFFILSVAALVSLWLLPLPILGLFTLTLVVLCGMVYILLLHANLRLGNSCVAFRLEGQEVIMLVLRNGRHLSGRTLPDSLVTPYIVILNIVLGEQCGKRSLLILPDAMGVESFRRLRVALSWGDQADQAAT